MTTPSDLTLANHEAAHAHEPWVLVSPSYFQPNLLSDGGKQMYRVKSGEFIGSDLTIESCLKLGRVEVTLP